MKKAIELSRRASIKEKTGGVFGAVVVKDGKIIAECCPMCLATAHWAHIRHIYYGATTEDSLNYGDFADVDILSEISKDPSDRRITFTEMMRPEAVEVWKEFSEMPDRVRY